MVLSVLCVIPLRAARRDCLFIPFTVGQGTDRKHNEGAPAHRTFCHEDLTVDDLSNFRSDAFILLCDQVFCK